MKLTKMFVVIALLLALFAGPAVAEELPCSVCGPPPSFSCASQYCDGSGPIIWTGNPCDDCQLSACQTARVVDSAAAVCTIPDDCETEHMVACAQVGVTLDTCVWWLCPVYGAVPGLPSTDTFGDTCTAG